MRESQSPVAGIASAVGEAAMAGPEAFASLRKSFGTWSLGIIGLSQSTEIYNLTMPNLVGLSSSMQLQIAFLLRVRTSWPVK